MNSIMERWAWTCRHERELLDRTLIWVRARLLHALAEFESFCDEYRPHCTLRSAAVLRPVHEPTTGPERFERLSVQRRDRPGGRCLHHREIAFLS
ncbi:integrase [Streptomyces sp. SD15]